MQETHEEKDGPETLKPLASRIEFAFLMVVLVAIVAFFAYATVNYTGTEEVNNTTCISQERCK